MDTTVVPSYEEFIRASAQALQVLAVTYGTTIGEVKQIAYLAWRESQSSYNRSHTSGASFMTYALAALKRMLRPERCGHVPLNVFDADEALSHEVFESATSARVSDPGEFVSTLLAQHCEQLAFPDAVRGHPVYTNARNAQLIEGLLAGEDVATLARRLNVTARRVYQMLFAVECALRERDVLALDRHVVIGPDGSAAADPVRYRRLSGLNYRGAQRLDPAKLKHAARTLLKFGQVGVVVIDQYFRVLLGEEVCAAAEVLGMQRIKTVLRVMPEGDQRCEDALNKMRAELAGEGRHEYEIEVIDTLKKRVANGSLSTLVATRLAHLPLRAQSRVAGALGGWLVSALSIQDANQLVTAYAHGNERFEQWLERKADDVRRRLSARAGAQPER
jgi:hypothetical protein